MANSVYQHYNRDVPKEIADQVSALIATANLTTNPTSVLAMMPSVNAYGSLSDSHFPTDQQPQARQGKGLLLAYTEDATLLMSLDVDVLVGTGVQAVTEDKELTPFTVHKMGRSSTPTYTGYGLSQYVVNGEGDSSGFVMTAPRAYYELKPLATENGKIGNEVLYHSTLLESGTPHTAYLLMTEDCYNKPLNDVPDLETLKTATPEQLTTTTPEFAASWVKLPIGTVTTDVVRLTLGETTKLGRLVATGTVRFSLSLLPPPEEFAAVSTVRAKMDTLGFEVTDHVTPS